ncbi:zinc finger protein 862-like [Haliotis asinina]|uniref:zinc finger protein 862-like n=1 Tax=Haliotis asinina TaxID=109174 RepID=UPI003531CB5F
MDKKNYDQIEKLFVTAFLIASKGKPLSDFAMHLDLLDREDLLVTTVFQEIEGVMLKLTQLKVQPETGENLKAFINLYSPQDGTFDGVIQLIGQSKHVNFKQDMFFNSLIDGIVKYIDKRFECFSQAPLKYFKVLDYTEWPTDRCSLSVYGCEEIDALLEHYHPLFTDEEKTRIKEEFTTLKGYLKNCKKTVYDCYSNLLFSRPQCFKVFLKIVELMFTISPCTAICERLFSSMNLVKSSHRSVLSQDNLNNILTIMTHGPKSLKDFNPRSAIKEWTTGCKGTRHVKGHGLHEQAGISLPYPHCFKSATSPEMHKALE